MRYFPVRWVKIVTPFVHFDIDVCHKWVIVECDLVKATMTFLQY